MNETQLQLAVDRVDNEFHKLETYQEVYNFLKSKGELKRVIGLIKQRNIGDAYIVNQNLEGSPHDGDFQKFVDWVVKHA